MKKILIIYLLLFSNLIADDFKLERIISGLDSPWSLTFIDSQSLLVTEKPGNIKFVNLKKKTIKNISHNLKILEDGQGGLLDILHKDSNVFVSYSEDRSKGMSSTSVARAKLNIEKLDFKNIFQAQPPIDSGYHFGSRLVIKNKHLYVTAGERGQGMIAQDYTKHPGSIIRIKFRRVGTKRKSKNYL
jgi:Glucose/sorbosone dehydrogenases